MPFPQQFTERKAINYDYLVMALLDVWLTHKGHNVEHLSGDLLAPLVVGGGFTRCTIRDLGVIVWNCNSQIASRSCWTCLVGLRASHDCAIATGWVRSIIVDLGKTSYGFSTSLETYGIVRVCIRRGRRVRFETRAFQRCNRPRVASRGFRPTRE